MMDNKWKTGSQVRQEAEGSGGRDVSQGEGKEPLWSRVSVVVANWIRIWGIGFFF